MPLYSNPKIFKRSANTAFNALHNPGSKPPHSGIYRCEGCGVEVVAEQGRTFPPTHSHNAPAHVRWRLVAYPSTK